MGKDLPNRAIVAKKGENEWAVMDGSFNFCFSLYPNDFLRISFRGKPVIQGYYGGCDRDSASVKLWLHDRNIAVEKEGFIRTGVKTASKLEKFNVDELGTIYPAKPEVRRGLA